MVVIRRILISLILICIGIVIGFLTKTSIKKLPNQPIDTVRAGVYKLTNPLLECEVADDLFTKELQPFKYKIEKLMTDEIAANNAQNVSVYFRDLNNGPWFGINERADFTPASLLKVPIMMAFFKQAETQPDILHKETLYSDTKDLNLNQFFPPNKRLVIDQTYTVNELIEHMIVYSDNNATDLLSKMIDPTTMNQVFSDLDVSIPDVQKPENYMSVKQYATFFRILFNASYLSKEMSNTALELLAQTDFNQGIRSQVPNHIMIAHKFGELRSDDKLRQFHDCGIIYYPGKPYLLCIMTRGEESTQLISVIAKISQKVYDEISQQSNIFNQFQPLSLR